MKLKLFTALFGLTILANAADPILRIGSNTNDYFVASFWAQKNNASNAVAGIAANTTEKFSTNNIPMLPPDKIIGGVGGGSQTPWGSDIDGAGYGATNINFLSGRGHVANYSTNQIDPASLADTNMPAGVHIYSGGTNVLSFQNEGIRYYHVVSNVVNWTNIWHRIDLDEGSLIDAQDYGMIGRGDYDSSSGSLVLKAAGAPRIIADPVGETIHIDQNGDTQMRLHTNGITATNVNNIVTVRDPINGKDAANKDYVDAHSGGGSDFGTNSFTVTTNYTFDTWYTNGSRCANLTAQVLLAPISGNMAGVNLIVRASNYTNTFKSEAVYDDTSSMVANDFLPIFHTALSPGAAWILTNTTPSADPPSIISVQNAIWPAP